MVPVVYKGGREHVFNLDFLWYCHCHHLTEMSSSIRWSLISSRSSLPPHAMMINDHPGEMVEDEGFCFLCLASCKHICPHCNLVHFCSQDHLSLHRFYSHTIFCWETAEVLFPGTALSAFPSRRADFQIRVECFLQHGTSSDTYEISSVSLLHKLSHLSCITSPTYKTSPRPLDLILIDPGTVVGPNYKGRWP